MDWKGIWPQVIHLHINFVQVINKKMAAEAELASNSFHIR